MDNLKNARTMNITAKITSYEKMRYTKIAQSLGISLSEWAASILNVYQNGYGEVKINSAREEELLTKIDNLEKKITHLENVAKLKETIKKAPPISKE